MSFDLYTLIYISVLSYTTYKSSRLRTLVVLRILIYDPQSYRTYRNNGTYDPMNLQNGTTALDHFVASGTTKSDDNQRHRSTRTSSSRIDSRKISCHCLDRPLLILDLLIDRFRIKQPSPAWHAVRSVHQIEERRNAASFPLV